MATTKPTINIDGNFSDWIASERIDYGDVPGYSLYATAQSGFLYFDLNAPVAIGANTTIWLNTDLNAATGYQIFGYAGGAEYNVNFYTKSDGTTAAALYTGADGQTLVLDNIPIAFSADHTSVELAIPLASIGNPSNPIDVLYDVNNSTFGPANYSGQPYVAPNADVARTPTHKVAIVYSDTTAANYFRSLGDPAGAPSTAYSDLFMAAQNQARMAGVSYDVIDESQLTNVNNLLGYDALIFPAMTDVNTAQLPAIMSALTSAVYDYHIGIITSGDFLTNDQTGAPLPGNAYANMETLLGLNRVSGGNSGDVTITAADVTNPIMKSYTANQLIQSYSGVGYTDYESVGNTPKDVLVNQNVASVGTIPGVTETTVGGATNVHFATAALLGDSNLLSNAIQTVVLGTSPGLALHTSRDAGIVAARMDMDQSQFPADVSPAGGGPGIYDKLIPILQQWQQQYDFTGSYYVNIGDNPNGTDPSTTNWAKSLLYYQAIQALGGEIGTHSYTHLINPPATTFTATTVGSTPQGSTTITLDHVPSFYGITVGMWLTGTGIGSNTLLPGSAGEGGAVANTQVIAVSGNTITISYVPAGFGGVNQGTIGTIAAGTTVTFSVPPENTNFLEPVTGTNLSGDGHPFTYQYEFGDSKTLLQQMLGTPIYGAAVPGAAETAATSQNILQYFSSGAGYTGYITGGWTGVDSGYPSAFGYISPTQQSSVYIAPNITFDFTEIQYEGKTVSQAEADWMAQFNSIGANAAGTPIVVWPIHDYGAAAWNTTTDSATGSPYTTQMYADFIANAYNAGYEFVTLEELASRIAAQEKAHIAYTTVGNAITATVTPDPTAPDLGAMALDVVNEAAGQMIQNVTNWYAYNAQELFLPYGGGSFTINLGTVQDDVTHIISLPMRGDLLSVTGDGLNLAFSMIGDGDVLIDPGQIGSAMPIVTGATIKSFDPVKDLLDLSLSGLGKHEVSVLFGPPPPPPTEVVSTVAFSADTGLSSTDFVTNTAVQTITGTLSTPLAAGDVVQVSLDNGSTWLTATAATGAATFSLAVTLSGSNTLMVRVANAYGIANTALVQAYVLDSVPETPTNLAMAPDSDLYPTDNITSVTKPTFTGKGEAGGLITVYDGATALGTAIVTATGDWSVTDTVILTDGQHSITANEEDLAGNFGLASAALSVTVDTLAPAAPTNLALAPASDSGVSNTDRITNVTTPTFTGTAEAGSLVQLYDGTTLVGRATASSTGSFSVVSSTLSDGVQSLTVTATDLAGNVSALSTALPVTIDTVPPNSPLFSNLTPNNGSNITLAGTGDPGTTVAVLNGTTILGSTTVGAGGTWSWKFAVGNGKAIQVLTAVGSDLAGNKSGSSGTAQTGTSGKDTLSSTAGNDVFYGGGGADTFVFASLFGHDVIADFAASGGSHDIIDFRGNSVLNSFTNVLSHATNVNGGVMISDGIGDTLMLNNVSKNSLLSSDFTFV